MPTVVVNGTELHYEELGSEGNEIVVSAQQYFDQETYQRWLTQPPAGYHVYLVRLRRPSRSDLAAQGPVPRWYPRWADDVLQFARALGLRRFLYTGSSHGAVIGWHLAVEHPELLKGLVAVVGAPHPRAREGGRASQMAARRDPAALRALQERLFARSDDPERLARRERLIERSIDRVLAMDEEETSVPIGIGFPDVATEEALEVLLASVRVPALLIGGLQDPWVTPDQLLRRASVVPGARLLLFQDESHMLGVQSPRRVVDAFRLFADELASTRAKPSGGKPGPGVPAASEP